MEKHFGPIEGSPLGKYLDNSEFQRMLRHILSPLELEAFKNDFQGFYYEVDGRKMTIDPGYGKALIDICELKFHMFLDMLKQIDYCMLGDIKKVVAFLGQEIKAVQLPPYLSNRLRVQGYKILYDLTKVGKQKLQQTKGIGPRGLKTLETLFKEGGCEVLFR